MERGVYSGSVAHIHLLKKGYISGGRGRFWKGRIQLLKRGGIFWEGGIDSGRVAHINLLKRGVYSGREG